MKTELLFTPAASAQTELLAVFAADNSTSKEKDAKPEVALLTADEAIRKAASYVLSTGEFKAEPNETLLLHAPEGLAATRLLIVGLGKAAKADPHAVRKAAGTAVRFAKPRGIRSLAIAAPNRDFDATHAVRAIAEGVILGDFDSDTYRTDRKDRSIQTLSVVIPHGAHRAAAETGLREGVIIAESQNFARTLINEPGNLMTPSI
ncbi:MAG: M17 family peptidase N-terminal domain-containing protein, partial [Silvibacterium sp.]